MTKHIELLLADHFTDQQLGLLQAAAEDGSLEYFDPCRCLLHFQQGDYRKTKYVEIGGLARLAEHEFNYLADIGQDDSIRRQRILPLIHAEWARRARPVPVTFEQPAKIKVAVRD